MNELIAALQGSALLISIFGGILIGVPTGPARFMVLDVCYDRGRAAALQMYAGLFLSITIYAALALFVGQFISGVGNLETWLRVIASVLLLGWGVLIIIRRNKKISSSKSLKSGSLLLQGFLVGLSNPVIPFVYLAFMQILQNYVEDLDVAKSAGYIVLFELFSFLTTLTIAIVLRTQKSDMGTSWKYIKIVMGIILVSTALYNLYSLM